MLTDLLLWFVAKGVIHVAVICVVGCFSFCFVITHLYMCIHYCSLHYTSAGFSLKHININIYYMLCSFRIYRLVKYLLIFVHLTANYEKVALGKQSINDQFSCFLVSNCCKNSITHCNKLHYIGMFNRLILAMLIMQLG